MGSSSGWVVGCLALRGWGYVGVGCSGLGIAWLFGGKLWVLHELLTYLGLEL
jgi:hypothetical protein